MSAHAPRSDSASASPALPSAAESPVSVLGLGMMGTALAQAFLRAGHPVTVWNRTAAKTGPLAAQGATPAATTAEAIAPGGLVVLCLMTNDNVREVLEALGDTLAGRTVANLTNGTPAQARELAAWSAERKARYLDGGIMAVPQMIGGPQAYVFYSGDKAAFDTHERTLAVLGGAQWAGDDPGLAALSDIALLTGMYGMIVGVMQAFALARTAGMEATRLSERLVPWVHAMLDGTPGWAAAIDSGEHLTDVSSIAVNQAALPNLLDTLSGQGVTTEFLEPLAAVLDRAVREGHGADGLSRLADLLITRRA
ncbi:NAD(P)-dependent oxidoreductase [Streptomyces sp. NPDC004609]|uniref:NAD(P)-dependent oxidoreductase n=1 Tax=Streptomyces sp. NPDC004609 TaxID=3364704 RepID=UPI0036AB6101